MDTDAKTRISDAIVYVAFLTFLAMAFMSWFVFAFLIKRADVTMRGCRRVAYKTALFGIDSAAMTLAKAKSLVWKGKSDVV